MTDRTLYPFLCFALGACFMLAAPAEARAAVYLEVDPALVVAAPFQGWGGALHLGLLVPKLQRNMREGRVSLWPDRTKVKLDLQTTYLSIQHEPGERASLLGIAPGVMVGKSLPFGQAIFQEVGASLSLHAGAGRHKTSTQASWGIDLQAAARLDYYIAETFSVGAHTKVMRLGGESLVVAGVQVAGYVLLIREHEPASPSPQP